MKMKTSNLIGPDLDWAVLIALHPQIKNWPESTQLEHFRQLRDQPMMHRQAFFSTEWAEGGPIIEREKIATWFARGHWNSQYPPTSYFSEGATPLIAAMRCYVASKLGDEVVLPKELI